MTWDGTNAPSDDPSGDPLADDSGIGASLVAEGPETKSSTALTPSAAVARNDVNLLAQQDASLIRLDQFRADPRFAGIDGKGETVVVIDTGIDLSHPFFGADSNHDGVADRIVYSYDFSGNGNPNASDTIGHGSNVASIIGSQDATYTGMAPGCNIIALKVFPDFSTSASSADITKALDWVVANRAAYNIVSLNLSLGDGTNFNSPTATAYSSEFADLAANNCVIAAASGNSYYQYQSQGVSSPSADPNAWSVGAVWDQNSGSYAWQDGAIDYTTGPDLITSFSQRSTTMTTVFAPGGQITGANYDGGTITESGTSQATPHIAGLVADMQQLAVQVSGHLMSTADLRATMLASADPIVDSGGHDNVAHTGATYPRVDAEAWGLDILNTLFAGTPGDDNLRGTAAEDVISGGAGNDTLEGGPGADTLDGGTGVNTLSYAHAASGVSASLLAGAGYVGDAKGDVLSNFQNVIGSAYDDTLVGDGNNNVLRGGAGNDILCGAGGYDRYFFGAGDGRDQIINGVATNCGSSGELDLGPGIATDQIWLLHSGNDLKVDVMGSTDSATLVGWYSTGYSKLQEIVTADGRKLDTQVDQLVQAMAMFQTSNPGFDPTAASRAPPDAALQNSLAAAWHS
ncbi:MAG: Hemolysin-type calcium-binding repeat-containing protein [Rhodospirillales bacterium]|nr:Hemolysin-type calcium-binding repeat-containing protein [Rhodospirillales bacterium]